MRKPTLLVICSIIIVWDVIPDELEKKSVLSGVSLRSAGEFHKYGNGNASHARYIFIMVFDYANMYFIVIVDNAK